MVRVLFASSLWGSAQTGDLEYLPLHRPEIEDDAPDLRVNVAPLNRACDSSPLRIPDAVDTRVLTFGHAVPSYQSSFTLTITVIWCVLEPCVHKLLARSGRWAFHREQITVHRAFSGSTRCCRRHPTSSPCASITGADGFDVNSVTRATESDSSTGTLIRSRLYFDEGY
jgi:hypothetical protein